MSREIHLSYRGVDCIIFVFRGEKKKPDLRSGPVSHSETKLQQSSPVQSITYVEDSAAGYHGNFAG